MSRQLPSPGLAPLIMTIVGLVSLIALMMHLNQSGPEIKYGQVYRINGGFYDGCTGKAIKTDSVGRVTLNNVVCLYDSLDVELPVPASQLVLYIDPSDNPYRDAN